MQNIFLTSTSLFFPCCSWCWAPTYVILFIGWEGVGLCSYLLIGYWFKNLDYENAAKKAFIMNRIGDLGFLIAIFGSSASLVPFLLMKYFKQAPTASTGFINWDHTAYFCRCHRKICTDPAIHLVARCDGRSHTGIRPDPCSNHGYSRYLHDRPKSYFI